LFIGTVIFLVSSVFSSEALQQAESAFWAQKSVFEPALS